VEFSFQLTPKDWQAYQKITMSRAQKRLKSWSFGFGWNLLLWMVITVVFTILFQSFQNLDMFTVLFSFVIFCAILAFMFIQQKRLLKALQPDSESDVMRMNAYQFNDDGITVKNDFSHTWYSWGNIKEVHKDSDYLILYLDNMRGLIFRQEELPDSELLCELVSRKVSLENVKNEV
jgi:hypothetical protein